MSIKNVSIGQKCVQWFWQNLNQPIIILIRFFFFWFLQWKNFTNEVPTISGKGKNTYIFNYQTHYDSNKYIFTESFDVRSHPYKEKKPWIDVS